MHRLSLALLSIVGLSLLPAHAGTLVGDWYQEDTKGTSVDVKQAFTQPYTQSSDTIQLTLGIKSTGLSSPADFYVIVSDTALEPGCLYTVKALEIDARPFSVKSSSHASDISQLTTQSENERNNLWQSFRKGKNLSLKIIRTCDTAPAQSIEGYTFNFSLKGSSAAYRFVTGQEVTSIPVQPNIDTRQTAKPAKPAAVETNVDSDDGGSILILVLVTLFIAVAAIKMIRRHARQDSIVPPLFEKKESNFSHRPIERETASTTAGFSATRPTTSKTAQLILAPAVSDLPRFKVERVIDGDTVIVSRSREKLTIRLSAIDCPEDGQEWGEIATAGLIKLIGGKQVHLEAHDTDVYARTVATLYVQHDSSIEWMNVNERMVTLGHAWVMRRFYKHLPKQRQDKLNQLERWAKAKKVGLWKSPDPIPPWNWRQNA